MPIKSPTPFKVSSATMQSLVADVNAHRTAAAAPVITPTEIAALEQLLITLLPIILSFFGGTNPTPAPTPTPTPAKP